MKAITNGHVVTESGMTGVSEGKPYLPLDSLEREHFEPSDTHSVCSWKGLASYRAVVVDGSAEAELRFVRPAGRPGVTRRLCTSAAGASAFAAHRGGTGRQARG